MDKSNYYQRNRDVLLNSKEYYRNMTDEQKQRYEEDKKI